jgi:transposase
LQQIDPMRPPLSRIDLGAIFVTMELSKSTWLITSLSPGAGERMSKHVVRAGDVAGLMERYAQLRAKAQARTGQEFGFVVILPLLSSSSPFLRQENSAAF